VLQINHRNTLKVVKIGMRLFMPLQSHLIIMHHNMPMKLQNPIQGGNALHPIAIQNPRLGNEHGTTILGIPVIQLGILGLKDGGFTSQGLDGVGVKVVLTCVGANLGGFLDHGYDIIVFEFAGAEPTGEAVGLAFERAEGVDGGFLESCC
jgi:hypothetical protein